jgi:Spy/CpxP family protein refolding chaperone
MKPFTRRIVIASAAAGVLATTATAWAFGGGRGQCEGAQDGPRAERMQERMQKRMADRETRLKEALKLNPNQENAWQEFTAAMQPPKAAPAQRLDRAEWDKLTTPQRMEKMQALRNEREAAMSKRMEAVKKFYATLTPEQQKTFDEQHQRMGHEGRRHGGRHEGMGPMNG